MGLRDDFSFTIQDDGGLDIRHVTGDAKYPIREPGRELRWFGDEADKIARTVDATLNRFEK